MIRPRINLYDPEAFPSSHDWLDAGKAFLIYFALFSLLFIGSIVVAVQKFMVAREFTSLEKQKQTLQTVMREFETSQQFASPDPAQIQHQEQLEKDIKVKKLVLELLSGHTVGNRTGFSGYFADLARKPYPKLWLTQIQLRDGGRNLAIVGRTLVRADVLDFFQSLSESKVYSGRNFQYFQMKAIPIQSAKEQPVVRFAFGNQLEAIKEVWDNDLTTGEAKPGQNEDKMPIDLSEKLEAAKNRPNPLAILNKLMGQGEKP
ncbi:MAG: hypothetical protein HQL74_06935 [Magnetococcales bacterium]|nr:hypothetical protein [Magnetococcales bacterium]